MSATADEVRATQAGFLWARLDEDEEATRDCQDEVDAEGVRCPTVGGIATLDAFPSYPLGSGDRELAYMSGPGHPRAVLADIAARRRVVELYAAADLEGGSFERGRAVGLGEAVRLLADVYSDHPDSQDIEWALPDPPALASLPLIDLLLAEIDRLRGGGAAVGGERPLGVE